ncbi:MAG: TPM domain-containing protein [Nitrospirae bacterium]|nr:TPM domain-containing protein [Nitrospirota bacterium]
MSGCGRAVRLGVMPWMLAAGLLSLSQGAEGMLNDYRPAASMPYGRPDAKTASLPGPLGYVSDHAEVLDEDWKARIRSVCQDLERKTGVEMVVVTVKTFKPYATAQDYAEALYQRWGIGTAQQDHGVLVLAAVEERQAAVTVGRSLYAVIRPEQLGQIGSLYLEPAFRDGQYGEGLYRTTVALASSTQDIHVGAPLRAHVKGLGLFLTVATGAGALAFLWWISRPDLRHPFGRIRKGEYWGSGQGGFGGNFGGFGGGMGGEGLK